MKKFILIIGICLVSMQGIYAQCSPGSVQVFKDYNRSGVHVPDRITIAWTQTPGCTYDLEIKRLATGETTTISGIDDWCYEIEYNNLFNGLYDFRVRALCPGPPPCVSGWVTKSNIAIESVLCQFDIPSACPEIAFRQTGIDMGRKVITLTPDGTTCYLSPKITAMGTTITRYTVQSIPYSPPYPMNTGTPIFVNQDDIFSDVINLPFGFCFYTQMGGYVDSYPYTRCVIGANGLVTFNSSLAGAHCPYSLGSVGDIPNTSFPMQWRNSIYGVLEDTDPRYINDQQSGGGIRWATVGTMPCRALCVSWHNVPEFSDVCHPNWETHQIVMYEGSNIIDVYVQKRYGCPSWNSNRACIGVMNYAGTNATAAPGRNVSQTPSWTTFINGEHVPEAWRFTPVTTPTYSVAWYQGQGTAGTLIGSGSNGMFDSIPIQCKQYDNEFLTVKLNFTTCSGDDVEFLDTVLIKWDLPSKVITDSVCINNPYTTTYMDGNNSSRSFNIPAAQNSTPGVYTYTNNYRINRPQMMDDCCPITDTLYLKVKNIERKETNATICKGETWKGVTYNEPGQYTLTETVAGSGAGCDTILTTHLNVNATVVAELGQIGEICSDDAEFIIPYNVKTGEAVQYTLEFTGSAAAIFTGGTFPINDMVIRVPIPANVRPDNYTMKVIFGDVRCGDPCIVPADFTIKYERRILEQNWNDVIAILNDKYNGGYKFSKYQWYKNGTALKNETGSYIYIKDGLDMNAEYSVALTREGEDYAIFTCSIQPSSKTDVNQTPLIVQGHGMIMITTEASGIIKVYDIYGRLVQSKPLADNYAEFTLPSGMYILDINLDNGIHTTEKVVIK